MFRLWPNYPNPFNNGTVIRFELPAARPAELAIYNLLGQRVATLVNDTRAAGQHEARWDGRDDRDRELAAGVYISLLQAGGQMTANKLLLLK